MGATGKVGTNPLEQFAQGSRRRAREPSNLLLGQLSEALSTGGVGARIPFVQRAVEASQQATSQGLARTKEDLARSGVGGLFARRTLAEQRQAGGQQASQIESGLLQQFISQTIPFLTATQQTAFGALQGVLQAKQFNAAQTANALDSIGKNAHPV
jgi:hypothetical protein